MKVEILEKRLRAKDREAVPVKVLDLEAGDIVTVSEATGKRWCALGWARDVSGEVQTGERKPGAVKLDIHNSLIK